MVDDGKKVNVILKIRKILTHQIPSGVPKKPTLEKKQQIKLI